MTNALIIDDNKNFRKTLINLLTTSFPSLSILKAENVAEAVKLITGTYFDIVFIDINLPGEKSFDLMRTIKITNANSIIMVLTYHDLPEYRDTAMKHGADYFLSKGATSSDEITKIVSRIFHPKSADSK